METASTVYFAVAILVFCGWLVAYMFERKGRSVVGGFALGLLAWVGILVALFVQPNAEGLRMRRLTSRKSRLWWLFALALGNLAVSTAVFSTVQARLTLPKEMLADGRYRIGDATFYDIKATTCEGADAQGLRCAQGGRPCASVQIACDASASAGCEYAVQMVWETETGRRFGIGLDPKQVSVLPGQELAVRFSENRYCLVGEKTTSARVSVKEGGGGQRRTGISVDLTKSP